MSGMGYSGVANYAPVSAGTAIDVMGVTGVAGQSVVVSGPSMNLVFAGATAIDPRITFARATPATYTNSLGVLTSAAANVPRLDYDPATLLPRGLLIEEQRTNLLLQSISCDSDTTEWGIGSNSTKIGPSASPDGSNNATVYSGNGSGGNEFIIQNLSFAANTTYTISCYARIISGTSPTAGNIISQEYHNGTTSVRTNVAFSGNLTANWTRFSVTFTNVTAGIRSTFLLTDQNTTAQIAIWGAQLEAGSFPTSYIPTTSAQVTRAADVATMTGSNFSSWYRQDEGTFVVEWVIPHLGGAGYPGLVSVDDGSINDAIELSVWDAASDYVMGVIWDGGVAQASLGSSAYTANTVSRLAVAYKANDFALSYDGETPEVDASGSVPSVTRLLIGMNRGAANFANGHIRRIAYYPSRLPNATLQALTA